MNHHHSSGDDRSALTRSAGFIVPGGAGRQSDEDHAGLILERYGSRAVIIAAARSTPVTIAAWIREHDLDGIESITTGEQWTVVTTTDPERATALIAHLDGAAVPPCASAAREAPAQIVIGMRFDGPDLAEVATMAALTVDEVVAMITSTTLEVGFCGFTAGFGYLVGLPEVLHVARRATPRTDVPAGSVAIAAGYAGIYPRRSPGGWNLIGTTDTVVWDPDRRPPGLLVPGTLVRLEATS